MEKGARVRRTSGKGPASLVRDPGRQPLMTWRFGHAAEMAALSPRPAPENGSDAAAVAPRRPTGYCAEEKPDRGTRMSKPPEAQ